MEYQNNDSTQDNTQYRSQEPVPVVITNTMSQKPEKKQGFRFIRSFFSAIFALGNLLFFLLILGVIIALASGRSSTYSEIVVQEGPPTEKIAIVELNGIIYGEQAEIIQQQLKMAKKDLAVKAVIVQIDSPGGTISASDRIHYEISKFRIETGKPVIAFMQGTAASGGYYTAVACEKIIAEPTTITGSIGAISSYLVFQELLEDKLGIMPVVVKSGEKKDWPSSMRQPTEEELQYMQVKLIAPALARFIDVVAQGRKDVLTIEEVTRLADGSIFDANEAASVKLIDQVGYLDNAIETVRSMAGLGTAQVVRYRRPFSFSDIISLRTDAQNMLKLDKWTIYEFARPEILYLWSAY